MAPRTRTARRKNVGPFFFGYLVGGVTILLLTSGLFAFGLAFGAVSLGSGSARPAAAVVASSAPVDPTPVSTPVAASQGPAATATATRAPASTATVASAPSTTQLFEQVRPSVVQIIAGKSSGTGMILDRVMNILTNEHVVEDVTNVSVRLSSGKTVSGRVVARDADRDLAIVRISPENLGNVRLGDSSALKSGEDVVAIGYALDLKGEPSISKGLVSGFRTFPRTDLTYIQTDAAVNPGNSGGPLLNARGDVVGIVSSRITSSGQQSVQNVGLAISITSAKPTIDRLLAAR